MFEEEHTYYIQYLVLSVVPDTIWYYLVSGIHGGILDQMPLQRGGITVIISSPIPHLLCDYRITKKIKNFLSRKCLEL